MHDVYGLIVVHAKNTQPPTDYQQPDAMQILVYKAIVYGTVRRLPLTRLAKRPSDSAPMSGTKPISEEYIIFPPCGNTSCLQSKHIIFCEAEYIICEAYALSGGTCPLWIFYLIF